MSDATGTIDESLGKLRYPLLTASVGTAIEAAARGRKIGLLVIHEFVSLPADMTGGEAQAHSSNTRELERFASAFDTNGSASSNSIEPLVTTHETPFCPAGVELLLGRLTTVLPPR